jgi:hypothetical protein
MPAGKGFELILTCEDPGQQTGIALSTSLYFNIRAVFCEGLPGSGSAIQPREALPNPADCATFASCADIRDTRKCGFIAMLAKENKSLTRLFKAGISGE